MFGHFVIISVFIKRTPQERMMTGMHCGTAHTHARKQPAPLSKPTAPFSSPTSRQHQQPSLSFPPVYVKCVLIGMHSKSNTPAQ